MVGSASTALTMIVAINAIPDFTLKTLELSRAGIICRTMP
jgi:hypothetical protein